MDIMEGCSKEKSRREGEIIRKGPRRMGPFGPLNSDKIKHMNIEKTSNEGGGFYLSDVIDIQRWVAVIPTESEISLLPLGGGYVMIFKLENLSGNYEMVIKPNYTTNCILYYI